MRSSPRPPFPATLGRSGPPRLACIAAASTPLSSRANHVPHPLENRPLLRVSGDMVLQPAGHTTGYLGQVCAQVAGPFDDEWLADHTVEASVAAATHVGRDDRRAGPNRE